MNRKKTMKATLIAALFLLAVGGWCLHLGMHPLADDATNLVPFLSGVISIVVIPLLFAFQRTVPYAYVANGMLAIIGTITMGYLSIAGYQGPLTLTGLLMQTLWPNIAILWGKFAVGKAIFDLEPLHSTEDRMPPDRNWGYPNMGWWGIHLLAMSLVYTLGNVLWR
jgi:hypothetical protein